MRTSIVTAVTHDGKGVMISGKEVHLLKNREIFMALRKIAILEGAHDKYASVSYQENDGGEELLNFRTPDAQKKFLAERAKEKKAQADRIAKLNDEDAVRHKPDIDLQEKRKAEKEAEIAAIRRTTAPFGYGKDGKPLTEPAK
jgi:hypothetical protein